jgi:hypothetical protein
LSHRSWICSRTHCTGAYTLGAYKLGADMRGVYRLKSQIFGFGVALIALGPTHPGPTTSWALTCWRPTGFSHPFWILISTHRVGAYTLGAYRLEAYMLDLQTSSTDFGFGAALIAPGPTHPGPTTSWALTCWWPTGFSHSLWILIRTHCIGAYTLGAHRRGAYMLDLEA